MLINLTNLKMPESPEVKKAMDASFLTKEKFAEDIEYLVRDTGMNYIDAIVDYCAINSIEIETIGKIMSKPLKEKLKHDADVLNYLKGSADESKARLPI
jgi:predicted aldo/keto reductase-like oxidoreductase